MKKIKKSIKKNFLSKKKIRVKQFYQTAKDRIHAFIFVSSNN